MDRSEITPSLTELVEQASHLKNSGFSFPPIAVGEEAELRLQYPGSEQDFEPMEHLL